MVRGGHSRDTPGSLQAVPGLDFGSLMLDAPRTLQAAPGSLQAAPGLDFGCLILDAPGTLQAAPGSLQARSRLASYCSASHHRSAPHRIASHRIASHQKIASCVVTFVIFDIGDPCIVNVVVVSAVIFFVITILLLGVVAVIGLPIMLSQRFLRS